MTFECRDHVWQAKYGDQIVASVNSKDCKLIKMSYFLGEAMKLVLRALVGMVLLAVVALNSVAAEFSRSAVVLDKMVAISGARPVNTASQNIVRIYVNDGAWGGSTCRGNSADVLASDKALIAVLLTAWTTGRSIDVGVDDTSRPIDSVCRAVWITTNK